MTIYQKFCFGLISLLWFIPSHALQIEGIDDGDHFTEIYQDGYYLRLENNRLMFRYHKGKCLMANDQSNVYVEDSCEKVAKEMSESISQTIAAMQQQYGGMMPGQGAELRKMMRSHEGVIELRESGSGEVAGYDATTYSAGSSKYWVSTKLLSQIKKEIDYQKYLKTQQRFEDAFSEFESMGGGPDTMARIEKELEAKGYLVKKTDASSVPGMNPMMMSMLPPEKRKEMIASMGGGAVVFRVMSVDMASVEIKKIKPSGTKVTAEEFLEASFGQ